VTPAQAAAIWNPYVALERDAGRHHYDAELVAACLRRAADAPRAYEAAVRRALNRYVLLCAAGAARRPAGTAWRDALDRGRAALRRYAAGGALVTIDADANASAEPTTPNPTEDVA
jgi:hypothetical protein